MNEDIGAKGGTNDRRRSSKIKKAAEKKRLTEEELKELEKKVKKKQLISFITVAPLALINAIINTFTGKTVKNKKNVSPKNKNTDVPKDDKVKEDSVIDSENQSLDIENKEQDNIELLDDENNRKVDDLVEKLKEKQIVSDYEEKLKEIRIQLRNSYFEEEILLEAFELENNPSEENLDKLNELIDRLEKYRESIKINADIEIDDDYISALSEEELRELEHESTLLENTKYEVIKSIDKKVEEIKIIEDSVTERLEERKEIKELDDEKFDELKEQQSSIEDFKDELDDFQVQQQRIVRIVGQKISINNNLLKSSIQLSGIALASTFALMAMKRQMRIPGVRSGRRLFNIAAIYLFYSGMMKQNKLLDNRRKTIELEEYIKDIETNIDEMDKILANIKSSMNRIKDQISQLSQQFSQYAENIEFKKLIANLEQMQKALEEKEYEIQKMKEAEQKKKQNIQESAKVYKL